MAALSDVSCGAGAEFSDGIRLTTGKGSVTVSPLRGKSALLIRGEGENEEIAAELCDEFVRRARNIDLTQ
jgi:hypothetical protein